MAEVQTAEVEGVSAADRVARTSRIDLWKGIFAGMERVVIRVPEDTRVEVNGYGFAIKGKEKVKVPVLVAEILEQSGKI